MLSPYAKRALLFRSGLFDECYVSLHMGDPGITGFNEVRHLRPRASMALSMDGELSNDFTLEFKELPKVTITHVGLWTRAEGGEFLWGGPIDEMAEPQEGDSLKFDADKLKANL